MTKLDKLISINEKLIDPLERRIETEIQKRMGRTLSKDLKELAEKGKAAKMEHERFMEETRKIILSRLKNRKVKYVKPKVYNLNCS